ncbi:MAG: ATP-binding protein [Rhodobacteraceae bacterium]|nr:ATP-binding protein [Paracoccaceae bacterium]
MFNAYLRIDSKAKGLRLALVVTIASVLVSVVIVGFIFRLSVQPAVVVSSIVAPMMAIGWGLCQLRTNDLIAQEALRARELEVRSEAYEIAIENLTHDLRTPIAQVAAVLDQASEGAKNGRDIARQLKIAETATLRLSSTVNDVLDLTRNEMDQSDPVLTVFEPRRWINDLVEPYEFMAKAKGLKLVVVDRLTVGKIAQDQHRLDRVIANLIDNAVKYTNRGSVTVEISNTEPRDGAFQLLLSVIDTGIGIPPDEMDGIFAKFGRAGNHFAIDGIGLGLSLVSKFASQLGASCKVESELDVGSRFSVEFPCTVVESSVSYAVAADVRYFSSPRILLVEDDPIYRELATAVLDPVAQVSVACDGEEAIEVFRDKTFDMVLMDIRMPNVDGIFATRKIREFEKQRNARRTPIWGVSANADIDTCRTAKLAGMDDLFSKPLTVSLVRDLVTAARPVEPIRRRHAVYKASYHSELS